MLVEWLGCRVCYPAQSDGPECEKGELECQQHKHRFDERGHEPTPDPREPEGGERDGGRVGRRGPM